MIAPQTLYKALRERPRLVIGMLAGIVAGIVASQLAHWRIGTVIGWNVGTILIIATTIPMMMGFDQKRLKTHARREDEGAPAILVLAALAALASLGTIILLLADSGATPKPLGVGLALLTIISSSIFIQTEFAMHYTRLYYAEENAAKPEAALDFPGEDRPDFADFLYFSAVIGMTSQTADVGIRDRSIRRLVIGHGMLAFFYNTTVLALFINIAAGLIGK